MLSVFNSYFNQSYVNTQNLYEFNINNDFVMINKNKIPDPPSIKHLSISKPLGFNIKTRYNTFEEYQKVLMRKEQKEGRKKKRNQKARRKSSKRNKQLDSIY